MTKLIPVFQTPLIDLYNGDCLEVLRQLPDESVDCCCTSPPYFALRDYGTATWDGGDPDCDHVANPKANKQFGNPEFNKSRPSREETKTAGYYADRCPKCGAERIDQQVGIEPTVGEYIEKLQTIFLEVQRVLKPTGTCWVNLGDSFAGSGKGVMSDGTVVATGKQSTNRGSCEGFRLRDQSEKTSGIKRKSLLLVPQRAAIAFQESGWIIRNEVIWSKASPMPSSKKDAMTVAHETIWFMVKEPKYYYDYEAVKQPLAESTYKRGPVAFGSQKGMLFKESLTEDDPNYRNGSEQWGRVYDYTESSEGGTRNLWDVWHLSPDPCNEAHFATWPREICRRAILAGCPPDGVVLDIFAGSGTTLMVAKELGRRAIGIELNPEYCKIVSKRCGQLTIFDALADVQSDKEDSQLSLV